MEVLDLFSGIGGFSLGLERAGMTTAAFCEIDPFCQKVLRKHWPDVPIYNDVRTLDYDGTIDVICGGFPCQPFSVAGKRKGEEDDRHLWPAMFSLIQKYRPRWVIGENVTGLINMGLDNVLTDLEGENYTTRAFVIPACAINAPHRRDRVWIVGHTEHDGSLTAAQQGSIGQANAGIQEGQGQNSEFARPTSSRQDVSNTNNQRCEGGINKSIQWKSREPWEFEGGNQEWSCGWPVSTPRVCGVDDGIPNRSNRLRALGNAVVPQIPEIIARAIMEIERGE